MICRSLLTGFTLIELMVVIVIISVILSFVTLSIGDGGQARQLEQEAQRLASLLKLARQEAIMQAQEMGVSFDDQGYHFYMLQDLQQWQPLNQHDVFHPRILPAAMQVEIHLEGEPLVLGEAQNSPQLLILSSGEWMPFDILFQMTSNENLRYRLSSTLVGDINVHRDEI